ncbi:MAG TPA: PEP/pyruvate-binding domain-containing protein [Gemmataceae bacterium]|nr:PEP/pyruvate-binding domain-containing protein [Gemmataceae bacterium]
MTDIRTFEEIRPEDRDIAGGKGVSLALLAAAGFPVPPGFCIATSAYRRLRNQAPGADPSFCAQIAGAYHRLGGGAVAVRSSATREDATDASYAGQQETVLGAEGEPAVLEAVARCWASLHSERALAYRQGRGADDPGLAMAVVVQRLVAAEVSGVLFTHDPLDPDGRRLLVEASWGLGESVVSGVVSPDRFCLDRQTGAVLERHIATKTTLRTAQGRHDVAAEKQHQPCLEERQLAELAELGRRVEAFLGAACDLEWAWAEGRLWLLQARPITTARWSDTRTQVRREEIVALQAKADPRGTVWSRYNLAETLPAPTPLTWALLQRFLSGEGGLGQMYRDLGFTPDRALDEESIYDLVCGRPYCNLSREPLLYRQGLPLEHPFGALKAVPQAALHPEARLDWSLAGWDFWLRLPVHFFRSVRLARRLEHAKRHFAGQFREQIEPAFLSEITHAANEDFSVLPGEVLLERLDKWSRLTLIEFARHSLKPTLLAAQLTAQLERFLAKPLGPVRSKAAVRELSMGARPAAEADLPRAIHDLAAGRMDRATFLHRFGHRGSNEMELASPRWGEEPATLDCLIRNRPAGAEPNHVDLSAICARIADEACWTGWRRKKLLDRLQKSVEALHTFLGLRETAKHDWLRGSARMRALLVELDHRFRLGGGIFYLIPEELPGLVAGADLGRRIAERRRRRAVALSLEVPVVLFSDDLEAIGRPTEVASAESLQGVPLSTGVAEGPALVLHEPQHVEFPAEPYILVCPSTDPAWVPLFLHAHGLVMETGGVLSHGAIVAREFGLPAVAGLPGIHRRLRSGQRLRVDGASGTVTVLDATRQE